MVTWLGGGHTVMNMGILIFNLFVLMFILKWMRKEFENKINAQISKEFLKVPNIRCSYTCVRLKVPNIKCS